MVLSSYCFTSKKKIKLGSIKIADRHHTYQIKEYDFNKFGNSPHPKLKKLAQYNINHDSAILENVNSLLTLQIPKDIEPFKVGADPRFSTLIDWRGFAGKQIRDTAIAMARIGQSALVTQDEKLIQKAKELALSVCQKWDPNKAANRRYNDLGTGNLIIGLGFCYDAAYHIMSENERKIVDDRLLVWGKQFFDHMNPFTRNEAQNHSWDNTHSFCFAAVVADSNKEMRKMWFDFAMNLYAYRFLPSLGFDGENNEGLAYWRFGFNLMMRFLDLAKNTADIDLYELSYVHKTTAFGLYSAPLAGYEISFGDNGTPNTHGIWTFSRPFCRKLAIETKYPEILWYSSIPSYKNLIAKSPIFMPQSVTYPHIGVSLFNTFLPDARENVAVGFHSGKYFAGHQHPDQNSFTVNAYGDKLIVDGGYYDWWGSPHFNAYSATTKAHNTLLIDGKEQSIRTFGADGKTTKFFDSVDFGFVSGDATNPLIYSAEVKQFERDIFFAKPNVLITFDRVKGGKNYSYLLHSQGVKIATEKNNFSIKRQFARLDGVLFNANNVTVNESFTTPPNDLSSSSMLDFYEKEWTLKADFTTEPLVAMEINRANDKNKLHFERITSKSVIGVMAENLIFLFNRHKNKPFVFKDINSDARALAIRFDNNNNVIATMVIDGTFAKHQNKVICKLAKRGDFKLSPKSVVETKKSNTILTLNGKSIPAKIYNISNTKPKQVVANITLKESGYLDITGGKYSYILGANNERYIGYSPRKTFVEKGEYILSFSTSEKLQNIKLQFTKAKKQYAEMLDNDFKYSLDVIKLEAENISSFEGEELYIVGRDFASNGKFGSRFHQSNQVLRWNVDIPQDGKYRIIVRSSSSGANTREIFANNQTLAVEFASTYGNGRNSKDWRSFSIPKDIELKKGKQNIEFRFNTGTSALDFIALERIK